MGTIRPSNSCNLYESLHISVITLIYFSRKIHFHPKHVTVTVRVTETGVKGKVKEFFYMYLHFFVYLLGVRIRFLSLCGMIFWKRNGTNGTQKSKKKEMKRRKNRRHRSAIFSLFIEYHIVIYTAVQCMYIVRDCVGHC